MNINKSALHKNTYLIIGLIIILHYALFNYTSFLYKTYVVNQQVAQVIGLTYVFSIYIMIKHLSLTCFPALVYGKVVKGVSIAKVLRLNKVTWKQLIYSGCIFILYNIISGLLILFQTEILKPFNLTFVMNSNPIPSNILYTVLYIIGGAIICPIAEELFFRGFLIRGTEKLGIHFAIITSGIYFALYHDNPYRLITLFLFAYLMGYIVYYTNSVVPGIVFHVLTNSIYIISLYVQGTSNHDVTYSNTMNGFTAIFNNNIVLFIILILSSLACYWFMSRLRKLSKNYHSPPAKVEQSSKSSGRIWIFLSLLTVGIIFIVLYQ